MVDLISLRHVGIVVTDMEKSLTIYRDIFNLEIIWDRVETGEFIDKLLQMNNVQVRTVKLKDADGGIIELLEYVSHPEPKYRDKLNRVGCSHIAITVENIDSMFKKLKDKGLQYNHEPMVSVDGKAKVAFFRDYDEVSLEIVEEINEDRNCTR